MAYVDLYLCHSHQGQHHTHSQALSIDASVNADANAPCWQGLGKCGPRYSKPVYWHPDFCQTEVVTTAREGLAQPKRLHNVTTVNRHNFVNNISQKQSRYALRTTGHFDCHSNNKRWVQLLVEMASLQYIKSLNHNDTGFQTSLSKKGKTF